MRKILLLGAALCVTACASTTASAPAKTSPLADLKNAYDANGLSSDDFLFDLVLGTRLAGIDYCNIGDVSAFSGGALSAKRLEFKGKSLPASQAFMGQTVSYAKDQGGEFYEASGRERACTDEHMDLLQVNYDNFANGNIAAIADMKKVYLPKSQKYTKGRTQNGLLNSGITQF